MLLAKYGLGQVGFIGDYTCISFGAVIYMYVNNKVVFIYMAHLHAV